MAEYKYCPLCGTRLVPGEFEGRPRMKCPMEGCGYVQWDNPLPVVAAVIEHDGKVLLARNRLWPEKMLGLVTGFLEKGEEPSGAVLREVGEELGLEGRVAGLIGVYPFFHMNQIIIAYHVVTTGEVKLGEEIAEIKLIPAEKGRPWPSGTGQALADWLAARRQ